MILLTTCKVWLYLYMSYPEKIENDKLIITVNGEIDLGNSENLRQQIHAALDNNKAVSVDMSAVNYIDSSGIAVLIESKQRAGRKQGI